MSSPRSTSDMPVVTSTRERCNLHGLILRPDGTCSRCEEGHARASSLQVMKWLGGGVVALFALAVGVRIVTAVIDARAARTEAAHAKVAAVAQQGGARVVVYTMSGCGACKIQKAWMASHNVAYVERSIDGDPAAQQELRALAGRGVLPTTVVDDEVLVGFNSARLESALRSHRAL